jgi:transcriptional regulator with XRE-family HTH domain
MSNVTRIHKGKQPNRPHYVQAWAEHRGFTRAVDLAAALEIDKSVVSRWYSGSTPNQESQEKLAELFHNERESLFRHPDDDWMAKFFRDRSHEELERMKTMLEAAFPRNQRTGTET